MAKYLNFQVSYGNDQVLYGPARLVRVIVNTAPAAADVITLADVIGAVSVHPARVAAQLSVPAASADFAAYSVELGIDVQFGLQVYVGSPSSACIVTVVYEEI